MEKLALNKNLVKTEDFVQIFIFFVLQKKTERKILFALNEKPIKTPIYYLWKQKKGMETNSIAKDKDE